MLTAIADAAGVPMPLNICLPVDMRSSATTNNAIVMTDVTVGPEDSLADIRELSREAYSRPPMGAPSGFPEEISQLLPDRLAHHLTAGAGERDALCSNIGRLPGSTRFPSARTARRGWRRGPPAPGCRPRRRHHDASFGVPEPVRRYLHVVAGRGQYAYFDSADELGELAVAQLAKRGLSAQAW